MVYALPNIPGNRLVFMKNLSVGILSFLMLFYLPVFSQKKLKKSDRLIVANIQSHVSHLTEEKIANEYIVKQFSKYGLKPRADKGWFQEFNIYEGKEVKSTSMLRINNDILVLTRDYFPFAFSANKSTEAAVSTALAENGVPWFKDLSELINDDDSGRIDTFDVIRTRAKHAAEKGASALIIYNKSAARDLEYNRFDTSKTLDIPVLYITRSAYKKYALNNSDIDVKLNVALEEKNRTGVNVIGFADNGADSTVLTTAELSSDTAVAALIETARLLKASKPKRSNYLFVTYCAEKNGSNGAAYYRDHPSVQNVRRIVQVDSVASTVIEEPKALHLVKRTVDTIRNN